MFFKIAMAEKETLAGKLDRKRTSPTESVVMREAAKGTLWSRYVEISVGIPVGTRYVQRVEILHFSSLNAGGTAGIYLYLKYDPVPEYVTVFRDFSYTFRISIHSLRIQKFSRNETGIQGG